MLIAQVKRCFWLLLFSIWDLCWVLWNGYLLLCDKSALTLSLCDVICAVEPVDTWNPEAPPYELGKIACPLP